MNENNIVLYETLQIDVKSAELETGAAILPAVQGSDTTVTSRIPQLVT